MSTSDRRAMLSPGDGELSLRHQCRLLGLARSGVYYQRRPANDNDLGLMRRLDELFTQCRSWARGVWRGCCGAKATPSTASGCSG